MSLKPYLFDSILPFGDKHANLDAFASDTIYGHFICTLKTHISCGENNVSKKVVNFFSIFFITVK